MIDRARLRLLLAALAPLGVLAAACGDPLTGGDWPGTPAMVVRGGTVPLPPELDAELGLALVWAPLAADAPAPATFPTALGEVGRDRDFGAFELALYDAPPGAAGAVDPPPAVGLLTVLAVPPGGLAPALAADELGARVRAVSADHYLVWVKDAARAREAIGATLLNPIALVDGYNLAVGVCRPGRPSQLLIVPPERVAIVAVDEAEAGQCLDVFWGPWR